LMASVAEVSVDHSTGQINDFEMGSMQSNAKLYCDMFLRCILFGSTALALLATPTIAQTVGIGQKPAVDEFQESVFPPWRHGASTDAVERCLGFTVPGVDNLADSRAILTTCSMSAAIISSPWRRR
jgi:hypothetical protein